jgi:predicted dienelactone hydrolase
LRDAAPNVEGGPYPVIYYSHGLFGARLESTYYTEHLASWGFVVFAVDHIGSTFFNTTSSEDVIQSFGYRPQEMMQLIAYAEELNDTGDYAGLMDLESQAVTGFSFGGYTSLLSGGASMDTETLSAYCAEASPVDNLLCEESYLQLLAETMNLDAVPDGLWPVFADERIKAIVPMAPCCVEYIGAEGFADITAPIMVMVGTRDNIAPAELNGIPAFEGASSTTKALVLLEGVGHEVFSDAYANESDRYHDLIKHFATAFFMSQLKDDADAAMLLDPSAANFEEVEYQINTP